MSDIHDVRASWSRVFDADFEAMIEQTAGPDMIDPVEYEEAIDGAYTGPVPDPGDIADTMHGLIIRWMQTTKALAFAIERRGGDPIGGALMALAATRVAAAYQQMIPVVDRLVREVSTDGD